MMMRRRRSGFTLVELLLALTITVLIGTATMTMMFAMSQGTRNQMVDRDEMVATVVTRARMNAFLRSSASVLDSGSDYVILWKGDTRADDAVNPSELIRIEFDSDDGSVMAYEAAEPVSDVLDIGYSSESTDFDTLTNTLIASGLLDPTIVADSVSAATLATHSNDRTLVEYQFQLIGTATPVTGCSALRGAN